MSENNPSSMDTVLGRIVVERGLATAEEVQQCIEQQRLSSEESDPNPHSLGDLMVANDIITRRQIDRLVPEIEDRRSTRQIPGYQVLEKIGAGAMATVCKARQLSLDRIVAIKVLPKKYSNNPQFIDRFYAEGKAAAKLNHPNIVQAIDVGKAGETRYFVMEFVEGETVYEHMTGHGPYEEEHALQIALEVAKALSHAHGAGFIHRDVKPKNIMITKDGVTKLADMGLARAVSDREAAEAEAGKAFGTPYYISPEQIRGELDVDSRVDIYGLGATLYHMVTGKVPFDGPNPSVVMHKHLKSDLVPPDHINEQLSTGIGEVIEVAMAKDCEKRYHSTLELIEDLEAVSRGEPPLQARKRFDLSALSTLDRATVHESQLVSLQEAQKQMSALPLLWMAIAGWVVAFILIVVVVLLAD